MSNEGDGAVKGVVTEDDTVVVERGSNTLRSGEQMDDVDRNDGAAVAKKQEGSRLDDPEANQLKIIDLTWEERLRLEELRLEDQRKFWEERERKQEREKRIKEPWLYEGGRLAAEPPDINYRNIILDDQELIELILQPGLYHFKVRCLAYQTYDAHLEFRLLGEYDSWCKAMLEDSRAQEDEVRVTFFKGLRDVVSEDKEVVEKEVVERKYDEGMVRGKLSSAVKNGSGRFFHDSAHCWFYHEEKDGRWHREPEEEGPQCDRRRFEWLKEALAGPEQRYFDCVERQFYSYDKDSDQWYEDGPVWSRWRPGYFEYDKEKCQWRAPDWLLRRQEENIAEEEAEPSTQEALENDAHTEAHLATEDVAPIPSPTTSTTTQPELNVQQTSTHNQAAYHITWLIATYTLAQVLYLLHILQAAWYLEHKKTL